MKYRVVHSYPILVIHGDPSLAVDHVGWLSVCTKLSWILVLIHASGTFNTKVNSFKLHVFKIEYSYPFRKSVILDILKAFSMCRSIVTRTDLAKFRRRCCCWWWWWSWWWDDDDHHDHDHDDQIMTNHIRVWCPLAFWCNMGIAFWKYYVTWYGTICTCNHLW